MADPDRDRDDPSGRRPPSNPGDEPRGTSAPAVGGTKTDADRDAAGEESPGEPPTNAGGKSTNNPDVGPSS